MTISRRDFLGAIAAAPLASAALAAPRPTDIRIDEVRHSYEDYVYRAPYKFGGRVVDRVTLLNVHCRVTTRNGKTATRVRLDDDGEHVGVPVEDDVVRQDARRDEGARRTDRAASRTTARRPVIRSISITCSSPNT